MKHILEVNDKTEAGKQLLSYARFLAKEKKGKKAIEFLSEEELEEKEDEALAKMMAKEEGGKYLTKKETEAFLKKLKADAGL